MSTKEQNMRTRAMLVGMVTLAATLAVGTAASAAPPHGDGGHVHHVHTGNGGCVEINAVAFHAEDRGLHQGANSSGFERGTWHGPCH